MKKRERLRTVQGYEGQYSVSSWGRVWSHYKEIWLKGHPHPRGYPMVGLHKAGEHEEVLVHRLVAQNFLKNPNQLREVNHKNGVKTDNRVENLEWVSTKENHRHAISLNLIKKDPITHQYICRK